MKIEESPFNTEHPVFGTPIPRNVLEHNAYVTGWEHGAADHRPEAPYWRIMDELGLTEIYVEGREDGKRARSVAWQKARRRRGGGPSFLDGRENQVTALVLLLDEAATMMSDATGSYGCEHLDDLDDWLTRARPFFPRNSDTEGAVQAVLDGRCPRPEEEPAAIESWRSIYRTKGEG